MPQRTSKRALHYAVWSALIGSTPGLIGAYLQLVAISLMGGWWFYYPGRTAALLIVPAVILGIAGGKIGDIENAFRRRLLFSLVWAPFVLVYGGFLVYWYLKL